MPVKEGHGIIMGRRRCTSPAQRSLCAVAAPHDRERQCNENQLGVCPGVQRDDRFIRRSEVPASFSRRLHSGTDSIKNVACGMAA